LSATFTPSDTSAYRASSATSGVKAVSNRSGNR
jgi:hypothetical protein